MRNDEWRLDLVASTGPPVAVGGIDARSQKSNSNLSRASLRQGLFAKLKYLAGWASASVPDGLHRAHTLSFTEVAIEEIEKALPVPLGPRTLIVSAVGEDEAVLCAGIDFDTMPDRGRLQMSA